jgi:hypothetical protein
MAVKQHFHGARIRRVAVKSATLGAIGRPVPWREERPPLRPDTVTMVARRMRSMKRELIFPVP